MTQSAMLYIVPTPIGHLEDISQRALNILNSVDLIVAEDTRHTGLLLRHFGIRTRLFALHDHNEQQKTETVVTQLQAGLTLALVSDAGTPLISDPGFHLVRRCRALGIKVSPLPGPCAAITALSAAGLATNRFCFEGFLPARHTERCRALTQLSEQPRTLVFYVAPHRLLETLQDMVAILGAERQGVLARELTKRWEEIHGATLSELLIWVQQDSWRCRGEMVLMVAGYQPDSSELVPEARNTLKLLMAVLPLKQAAALTAEIHNSNKNALYRYGLQLTSA